MDKFYEEITKHLIEDDKPSIYLNSILSIIDTSKLKIISDLKNIPQEPKYHPEGDVWNHIMLVVDEAAKLRYKANDTKSFMLAALMHDIGKTTTTKQRKGRWTSYNHDTVGAKEVQKLLECIGETEEVIKKVVGLVKHHMNHIYILKDLSFGNVQEMILDVDMNDMLLIFYSDMMGRGNSSDTDRALRLQNVEKIKEILLKKYSFSV